MGVGQPGKMVTLSISLTYSVWRQEVNEIISQHAVLIARPLDTRYPASPDPGAGMILTTDLGLVLETLQHKETFSPNTKGMKCSPLHLPGQL